LRVLSEPLSQEAIDALNLASNDSNADVADAAQRALSFHALVDREGKQRGLDRPQQAAGKASASPLDDKIGLEKVIKTGASQFYWIAALSIINSIVVLTGRSWTFFIGLGVTQFIDGIFIGIAQIVDERFALTARIIGFVIDIIVASVFVLFGFFAQKRKRWAFIAGMVLYALDSLILLLVLDFLGFGFHILLLFFIYVGMSAMKRYSVLMKQGSA
jgi:hypothetical protein